ncbi:hypothetical protein [Streptomyces purpureus]|uniref:Uncharacterized protein n=1 Tax=Streptomyces purpureus TaxID=1951 RepID=A0A918GW12_9ACTN|nr:hypothetical protein [Streptomyces purpureus]GGT13204.1 hypothetical protein GCM10014713_02120 [Streptomyces purpureus]
MPETDPPLHALLAELGALSALPGLAPRAPAELEPVLARVRSAAGHWADVLDELRESAQGLAGPGTAAALELAFRRAEESYVELEIALGAATPASAAPPRHRAYPA